MTTCPYCRQKFSATPALNEIQKFTEHLNEAHLSRGRNIYTVFDALRVRKGWDTRNIGEGQDRQIALPRGDSGSVDDSAPASGGSRLRAGRI